MAQTLRFNLEVDQSQVANAVSSLQSGLSNQLQTGALQLSGMYGGMGQVMANMSRQAGGASHSGMHQAYSMSPTSLIDQNAHMPFRSRRESFQGYMQSAMKDIQQTALYATQKFASKIEPPKVGMGQYVGNKLVDATMGIGKELGMWTAGTKAFSMLALGSGPLGLGVMAAGMGASYIGEKLGVGKLFAGAGSAIKSLWGGNKAQEGSAYRKQIMSQNKADVQYGAGMMKLMGLDPGMTSVSRDKFYNQMMSTGTMMRDLQKQFKIPSRDLMSVITAGTVAGTIDPRILKGGINDENKKRFADMVRSDIQGAANAGMTPTQYGADVMSRKRYENWKVMQANAPSPWTIMGNRLGTGAQIGRKFGRQLIGAVKPLARTDLLLSSEERKWLGGSMGAAAMYSQQAMNNMRPGQPGHMAMASLAAGINPSNMMQALPQLASAYSNPATMFKFQANTQQVMRGMGGKGVEAVFAQQQISQAKWVQSTFAPDAKIHDIMTSGYIGKGMSPTQARAMTAMTLRQGNPLVYATGKGGKLTDPSKYTATIQRLAGNMLPEEAAMAAKGGGWYETSGFSKNYASAAKTQDVENAIEIAKELREGGVTAEQAKKKYGKSNAYRLAVNLNKSGVNLKASKSAVMRAAESVFIGRDLKRNKGLYNFLSRTAGGSGKAGVKAQLKNIKNLKDIKKNKPEEWAKLKAQVAAGGVLTGYAKTMRILQNQLDEQDGSGKVNLDEKLDSFDSKTVNNMSGGNFKSVGGTSKAKKKNTRDLIGVLKNLNNILAKMANDGDVNL